MGMLLALCLCFVQDPFLTAPAGKIIVDAPKLPQAKVGDPPKVSLPENTAIGFGRLAQLSYDYNGKNVEFTTKVWPEDAIADVLFFKSDKSIVVSIPQPVDEKGMPVLNKKVSVHITAATALGDVVSPFATCVVSAGTPGPPPPPPPPPGPTEPTDPWYQPIKAVYLTESVQDKAKTAALAAAYRKAAKDVHQFQGTVKQFFTAQAGVVNGQVGMALTNTRKTVGLTFDGVLPTQDTAVLTDATRSTMEDGYNRMGAIFEFLATVTKR